MPGYENLKTDANGVIPKIDNTLSAGTYQLREKSTLSGYELLSTNIEFTVSPTGEISLSEEAPGEATLSFDINSDDMCVYTLTVENSAGAMLTIEKQVTGDFGDKTIAFPFKVTVPGTNNGDTVDVYVNGVKDPSKALTVANEQVSFSLQHGGSITLKLPKNKLITVTEENGVYMASWQLGGAASSTPGNSAELTLTGNATLTFTNLLNAVAPTGYRTETLPYLLLMLAGILLLVLNRKRVFAGKRR